MENIYKIHIYIKRLERQYLEVFDKNPDAITPNVFIIIINKKIELLYEKLAHLI